VADDEYPETLMARKIVVLTYDPDTDITTIDGQGLSPLEVRGIIADAYDVSPDYPNTTESEED
jgi:hypothetical protein